jgi:hypothetical protein
VPHLDRAGVSQTGEQQALHHGHALGGKQQFSAVEAVGPDAAEGSEHQDGDLPGKARDPEQPGRAGEPVDQPAHGDQLYPGADHRQRLPAEKQPVVTVAESAQRVFHGVPRWGEMNRIERMARMNRI